MYNGYTWTITFLGDGNDYDVNVADTNNKVITNQGIGATYVEFVQTKLFDGEAFAKCTETDVVLSGLVQGTPYFTRVIAYNTLGYGLTATLSTAEGTANMSVDCTIPLYLPLVNKVLVPTAGTR